MTPRLSASHAPLAATGAVFMLLYAAASLAYPEFFTWHVFVGLLRDNAFLGVAALGMTFVILSGGIDLSVGAVVGLSSLALAGLVEHAQLHPLAAIPLVLAGGAAFGCANGWLIHALRMPPFLVTLAAMFLARGLAYVVSLESIAIDHPFLRQLSRLGGGVLPFGAVALLLATSAAGYVARQTRFGRAVYAVGGSETSARLMGVPIGRTKVGVYALSGLSAAGAGLLYALYTLSGNPNGGSGLELDAIAAVVIGGTLLSGGVGHVAGTLIGVLILGLIQTAIVFQGTLSSWWTRIAAGGLLLLFILFQRLIEARFAARRPAPGAEHDPVSNPRPEPRP